MISRLVIFLNGLAFPSSFFAYLIIGSTGLLIILFFEYLITKNIWEKINKLKIKIFLLEDKNKNLELKNLLLEAQKNEMKADYDKLKAVDSSKDVLNSISDYLGIWHKHSYAIGIVCSDAYRETIAKPVCEKLASQFPKGRIFYDEWYNEQFNGVKGNKALKRIYREKCTCIVVLLSPDFNDVDGPGNSVWPEIEELINTGKGDKICLLKVGAVKIGEIDGLYNTQAITKTVDDLTPQEIADFIIKYYVLFTEKYFNKK